MTFWRKLLGIDDEEPEPVAPAEPAEPRAEPEDPPLSGPEERLRTMADGLAPPVEPEALELIDAMCASGREARAIDHARRLLSRHPGLSAVTLRVAEILAARGNDPAADGMLARLTGSPSPATAALMLRGEIAERRGDEEAALGWYERVLARELDYPGASERVRRLRESREPAQASAGATLMTDGALAKGRYRVTRELGRGGAGTVFAALDTRLGRQVALKVYHRRGRLERERLRVEAQTPALLEHPGVIRIFDLDESLAAIAMEWVRGGSVRQELRKGAVASARVVRWMTGAADALDYVHRHGYVHRDLKPSNFLLREEDVVVLTDFGLAAPIGATASGRGGGEGTLAYMAPEQRLGAPAEPAADVHALGATLREMLSQCAGEAPGALLDLAEACTRRDPTARPSLRDVRQGLAEATHRD